jgi:hypothetical protein
MCHKDTLNSGVQIWFICSMQNHPLPLALTHKRNWIPEISRPLLEAWGTIRIRSRPKILYRLLHIHFLLDATNNNSILYKITSHSKPHPGFEINESLRSSSCPSWSLTLFSSIWKWLCLARAARTSSLHMLSRRGHRRLFDSGRLGNEGATVGIVQKLNFVKEQTFV